MVALLAPAGDPCVSASSRRCKRLGAVQAQAAAAVADTMAALPADERLPLIELAIPQLVVHPAANREALIGVLEELASADGSVSMFEYCATRLVWVYLRRG